MEQFFSVALSIVLFILVLGFLVIIHELGHFFAAKRLGIGVLEFGFGFPPKIWSKKVDETEYSFNLLPIGGFVRLVGEDVSEHISGPKSFQNRTAWEKTQVVVAGVLCNFLVAFFISSFLYSTGVLRAGSDVVVSIVNINSAAEKSGLTVNDVIKKINGVDIKSSESLISQVDLNTGKEITLEILRNNSPLIIKATPDPKLGISIDVPPIIVKYPWYIAPWEGLKDMLKVTVLTIQGLGTFFTDLLGAKISEDVTGVVGIANITHQVRQLGVKAFLELVGLLSLNLAILNIMPIPALDGGRLTFIILEKLRGKPINTKIEQYVHVGGFVFLILLMIIITIHDVSRLF